MVHYLFMHGLGQQPSSWHATLSCLSKPVETTCLDLFAWFTDQNASYTHLYECFSTYCHKLDQPLHLCGLSLGGILALHYAIEHPKKVQSLVLINTQFKMPKWLLRMQNSVFRFMPHAAFHRIGLSKKDMLQLTRSMMDLDFTNALHRVSCPTLVLCGEKDWVNQRAAKHLAHLLPKATLQQIPKAHHEVNVQNPQQLAAALNAFYQLHQ